MSTTHVRWEVCECEGAIYGVLTLNRPEVANAMSASMLEELYTLLSNIPQDLRFLVLRGEGKNFCAGADLRWMKDSAHLSYEANKEDAQKLVKMYEALHHLPIPTLAIVQGAAYGGAVGLAAACDYVIATKSARFCLSEVKVGLIPAVILPYVARKMSYGATMRYSMTADLLNAEEAKACGLVQSIVADDELSVRMQKEVNLLLAASPAAQRTFKALQKKLRESGWNQNEECVEAIARIRTSEEAQKGLKAFLNKNVPPWVKKGSWS